MSTHPAPLRTAVEPLVRLRDASFGYDASPVLRSVTLDIARGQFSGIVGPSGSGKTTLLKMLLGTVSPQHGLADRASRASPSATSRSSRRSPGTSRSPSASAC